MLNLKHTQAFILLASQKHFGKTAKMLGISQSALSMQIRSLEEDVGGALINRSNRTAELTSLGEVFLRDAQKVIAMVELTRRDVNDVLDNTVATLRLGCSSDVLSSGFLRVILGEMKKRYPQVEVTALEEPPAHLLKLLEEGQIDCMLGVTFGLEIPKNVVQQTIAKWPAVLVASQKLDILDENGRISNIKLSACPYIFFEKQKDDYPHVLESMLGITPRKIIRLASFSLILAFVDAGLGTAIVPASDKRFFGPETRIFPIPGFAMDCLALRLSNNNAPTVLRFFRLLREMVQEDIFERLGKPS